MTVTQVLNGYDGILSTAKQSASEKKESILSYIKYCYGGAFLKDMHALGKTLYDIEVGESKISDLKHLLAAGDEDLCGIAELELLDLKELMIQEGANQYSLAMQIRDICLNAKLISEDLETSFSFGDYISFKNGDKQYLLPYQPNAVLRQLEILGSNNKIPASYNFVHIMFMCLVAPKAVAYFEKNKDQFSGPDIEQGLEFLDNNIESIAIELAGGEDDSLDDSDYLDDEELRCYLDLL